MVSGLLADAHAVQEDNEESREPGCQDHDPDVPEIVRMTRQNLEVNFTFVAQ